MTDIFDDEYTLHRANMAAFWEHIGEGYSGEYNPDDLMDVQLLRFTVYKDGEQMEDASYCTQMPVGTDPAILRRGLILVLDVAQGPNPKRGLELLSWMKPDDFKEGASHDRESSRRI